MLLDISISNVQFIKGWLKIDNGFSLISELQHPSLRYKRNYEYHRVSKDRLNENSVKVTSNRATIFATDNSTVIEAQRGGTAKLPCVVRKFANAVVSIIKISE